MTGTQIHTFAIVFNRRRKNIAAADQRQIKFSRFQITLRQPQRGFKRELLLRDGQHNTLDVADLRQEKSGGVADGIGKLIGAGKSAVMFEDLRDKGQNLIDVPQTGCQKNPDFFLLQFFGGTL